MKYDVEITWPDGETEIKSIFGNFRGLARHCDNVTVRPSLKLLFDPEKIPDGVGRDKVNKIIRELFGRRPKEGVSLPGSISRELGISVFKVGTEVMIGGDVPAIISAITIRHGVLYECVWWDNRTRKSEWLQEWEVMPRSALPEQKDRIGFK